MLPFPYPVMCDPEMDNTTHEDLKIYLLQLIYLVNPPLKLKTSFMSQHTHVLCGPCPSLTSPIEFLKRREPNRFFTVFFTLNLHLLWGTPKSYTWPYSFIYLTSLSTGTPQPPRLTYLQNLDLKDWMALVSPA